MIFSAGAYLAKCKKQLRSVRSALSSLAIENFMSKDEVKAKDSASKAKATDNDIK